MRSIAPGEVSSDLMTPVTSKDWTRSKGSAVVLLNAMAGVTQVDR